MATSYVNWMLQSSEPDQNDGDENYILYRNIFGIYKTQICI